MTYRFDSDWVVRIAFGVLTFGNIGSSTMFIWLAARGGTVADVLPFCLVTWSCYFSAHYLVEGEIVDKSSVGGSTTLPDAASMRIMAVIGLLSMVLAFPIGIVAVRADTLWLLTVSLSCFVVGYNVGHYGLTGKLL